MMQMLYDSDDFVVVYVNATGDEEAKRDGFEIVDKRVNKEVYLDGPWATAFQAQINRWQENTPSQEEVEAILHSYCELAQIPLVVH
jgi:hypothetical protein